MSDSSLRLAIIEAKLAHPRFGPKKVMDWLRAHHRQTPWPADSTAGEILKQAGFVQAKTHRRRVSLLRRTVQ